MFKKTRCSNRAIAGEAQTPRKAGWVIVLVDEKDDLEATVVVSPTSNREQQGRLVPTVAVIGATDLLYTVNDAVFARRPITFPDASVPDASVPASSWSDGVSAADCDGGSTLETNAYRSPGRDGFGFVTTHAGVSPSGEAPPSGTATMWFKWRGSGLFAPNGLPTTVFAACVKKPDAKEPKSCDRLVVIEEGYLKMSDGGARVAVEPDVWHHLALTWSDSTTRLWLDGVDHRLVGAASPAGKSLVYGGIRALTSWGYAGSDCYAVIDDLQLWKREISREEIIESMLRPKRCR